jgi:hypothetical protein
VPDALTKLFSSATDHTAWVSMGRILLCIGMTFGVAILFSIVAAFHQYRDTAASEGK